MIQVVYKSRKNNKKLALAISDELKVPARPISKFDNKQTEVLFLGCAILGGTVSPKVEQFVETLDSSIVKKIVLFSANGFGTDQFKALKKKISEKGIEVSDDVFSCKGSAFIFKNMKHPNQDDIKAVKEFARKVVTG